ncbi:MAG TPA: DMT family transporter [Tepidisphaeraceae bacterium]|nr:DMT family transporter [Tepidisphaeraceae bacterium]
MIAQASSTDLPIHLLFPLASSLLYVAAALSLRRAAQAKVGVWRSTFVMNVIAALCFLPLLAGTPGPGPTPVWQAAIVGVLFVGGQALTMIALNKGDVSVATPVMGTKVIFVAVFVTLLVGDPLPVDYWVSAAASAAGIALLSIGPRGANRPAGHRHVGLTIAASLGAAACYALFDVLVRMYSPAWGIARFLPAVMLASAVLSLAFWPIFEGRLREIPKPGAGPLLLGSLFLGLQALLLVRTLGLYPDTTRINVVYNSRGLWSVIAVWLVGHWWGNTERHAGHGVMLRRIIGAALLLGAIVIAVTLPFTR